MYILGISAFYHDAAAALIKDGEIVAAAQEERFTRIKHDESFPVHAIKFCLEYQNITVDEIESVIFYEKPFLKFERLLETYLSFAPKGIISFIKAISVWSKKKLFIKKIIKDELKIISGNKNSTFKIFFSEHHLSHAASAFYTSGFSEAAVLVIDAVGESATTSVFSAKGNAVHCLKEMNFPHSVGLLYSAFTYYLGFKVNSGEYKLMGLAPYGNANDPETTRFKKIIEEKLCTVFDDGSIFLQQEYFNYATGLTMVNEKKWQSLFGFKKRNAEDAITNQHCNLALAIQTITESIIVKLAEETKRLTGSENLCMAGGVALNCVANAKLLSVKIFKNIYIQPAAGDAGAAIGAALALYHVSNKNEKKTSQTDPMNGTFLGPSFSNDEAEKILKAHGANYKFFSQPDLYKKVASLIGEGNVVGWFRGRMEFGPRALGNRSILADPRNKSMQQNLNLKIKYRKSFRPFAPAVLEHKASMYFHIDRPSPYMLFVHGVKDFSIEHLSDAYRKFGMEEKLQFVKGRLPAITHAGGTARVQTVNENNNSDFWKLLSAFDEQTGCPVLINTSFNVRGEPIVCTPLDALRCFLNTEMDVLVLNDFILLKSEQVNVRQVSYSKGTLIND